MKKTLQLLLITIITVVSSCKKNEVTTTPDPIVPFEAGKTITTVVAGKVTAQDGTALNNVEITIGTSTTVTDANGNFIIPKATLSEKAGFIKATKSGYFGGSRTIIAKEKVVNNVVIQLVKKTISGDFTNANGGTITVATGGSVVFPANAVVTKSGAAYSGTVKVSAYFLDPTSSNCYKEMPGDLRGINASNNEQILTSYGMMAVELNGSNGEALQLATGKNATVTFPIATATQSAAPTTIPLWFFDETKGMWVEQGTATKTGNNYVGTVSHFTWWNCDMGVALVRYKAKFVDQNGNPISNVVIKLTRTDTASWNSTIGWTASDGSIEGSVPLNVILKVYLYPSFLCSNNYIQLPDIGLFTTDSDGGTIVVTIPTNTTNSTMLTIKGTVNDCNNTPIVNGYAIIHLGTDIVYTNIWYGTFIFSKYYCLGVPTGNATVDVFDLTTLKQNTSPATVNITGAGTYNIGAVQACGVQNYIHYTANFVDQFGVPLNYFYVTFSVDTGMLSFNGQNGNINAVIPANKIATRKLYVYTDCQGYVLVDSTQIGPFVTDFNAGTISVTVPQANTFTISGTVNTCSSTPVTNGFATVMVDNKTYTAIINNGSFSVPVLRCNTNTATATIDVLDNVNHQQNSTPITVSVSNANVNIGSVQACGLSANEYFDYNLGSNPTKSVVDTSSAYLNMGQTNLRGASGNFTTGITYFYGTIDGSSIGTHPVTITLQEKMYVQQQKFYNSQIATTTITEYGSVGQYITGTFTGTMQENNTNNVLPISGSFRIKRTQ